MAAVGELERRGVATPKELPIHAFKEGLVETIHSSRCVVVTGETGCGKTTQLPQFLLRAGLAKEGAIAVTQPRRVAAISVAHRVSEEMGVELGREVGYQVRFDDCTSASTVIKYMTDGCLLREFLDDAALSRYSVVVLDEAHERSLATDILFGLVKQLLDGDGAEVSGAIPGGVSGAIPGGVSGATPGGVSGGGSRRTPLKVVIMSATLDSEKFSTFFNSCRTFSIPGQTFPVSLHYSCSDEAFDAHKLTYTGQMARAVMSVHLDQPEGDILAFLTGQSEIESMCNRLFQLAEEVDYEHDVSCHSVCGLKILPLYGAMSTEQQHGIFSGPEPGIRRVIIATNIATTSVTIDGIVYVVDCGYVKQLAYNPRTGLDSLDIVPIAKSEAIQRAGRAGRTAPGHCFRLYSKKFYEGLAEATVPEIQRTSLASVILSLKSMGIVNVVQFQYLDPPEEGMILEALRQLFYFRAIDNDGYVTDLGRQLVQFPLLPSLARVLLCSKQLKCEEVALPIVAMLSVENVFIRPSSKKEVERALEMHKELAQQAGGSSDFSTLFSIYQLASESGNMRRWCRDHYIHWRAIKTAQSVHQQLQTLLEKQPDDSSKEETSDSLSAPLSQRVREALCFGLFGCTARLAPGRRSFRTMDGHSTVCYIHPGSVLFGKHDSLNWVVYHELVDTAKTYMRTLCPIRYSWVKDLLPQLHEIDVYRLSACAKEEVKEEKEGEEEEGGEPLAKKLRVTDRAELSERAVLARERYLLRKENSVK